MITKAMEEVYEKLTRLSGSAGRRNNANNYISFQVDTGKGWRNTFSVNSVGASFLTENQGLLAALKRKGLHCRLVINEKQYPSFRRRLHSVTPDLIDTHADEFKQLVSESVLKIVLENPPEGISVNSATKTIELDLAVLDKSLAGAAH